jgi:MFS family permease
MLAANETRAVISLSSLYIVRMLGLFMVLPVLTLAGDQYTGSSVFLLGFALGIYGLTQACLQIPYGILSDRFGRKPLIIIGLLIFALGSIIAASANSIEGLILGRALQGAGAIAGVIMAMVADLTTDKSRTKAMATIGASIGVAFALSLVIGPLVTALGGVRAVFWLTLVLSLAGVGILLWLVPAVPEGKSKPLLSPKGLLLVIVQPDLLRLNLGVYILHAVLMALFVVLPHLLESVAIPRDQHAWVYLGVMLVSFCIMVPLIITGERKQCLKTVFLSALAIGIVGMLLLALVPVGRVLVVVAMLLFFIAFNYLEATLPSLMSKTVAADQRGAGSGLFSTCQFLGAATGGIVGGGIYSYVGLMALLLACAALFCLWWLLALGMYVPVQSRVSSENVVA